MALANTHRAYVLVKGEVALEGVSKDLADSPELMAAYLGETHKAENPQPSPNGQAKAPKPADRKSGNKGATA
jgi:hypothetical protein